MNYNYSKGIPIISESIPSECLLFWSFEESINSLVTVLHHQARQTKNKDNADHCLCYFLRGWGIKQFRITSPNGITETMEKTEPDLIEKYDSKEIQGLPWWLRW